jgi:hypothetical protein
MADTATGAAANTGYTVVWEDINCRLKSGGMFSEKKVNTANSAFNLGDC